MGDECICKCMLLVVCLFIWYMVQALCSASLGLLRVWASSAIPPNPPNALEMLTTEGSSVPFEVGRLHTECRDVVWPVV